jgi:hypothetical protein
MNTTTKQSFRWQKLEAKFVGTLVYLDEPQVVLLDRGDDAKIIAVAIDKPGLDYPFLGAEISYNQLVNYQRELVDLRNLFLVPRWRTWYIFDLAAVNDAGMLPLKRADKAEYRNEEYLPSPQFFARNHTHELVDLPTAILATQRYNIDGTWLPTDLSVFFARINDLYSFFLGIQKFNSSHTTMEQKKRFIRAFSDHPLRGGSSYVGLYGDLKGLVSFEERLAMGGIEKKSPGYVDIEGKSEILDWVIGALHVYARNTEEISSRYRILRGYLSKMKLLKADPDKLDLNSPVASQIKKYGEELAQSLGVEYASIEKLTGNHILLSAKILLSHYRRLERYNLFFVEGRVQWPEGYSVLAADMSEFLTVDSDVGIEEPTPLKLLPPQKT